MSLFLMIRRTAATTLLTAMLLAGGGATAQDKDAPPDPDAVVAKIKPGTEGFKKVREQLATDPDSPGSRVRVDGFAVSKDKEIEVSGVMLVPGATDDDRTKAERATKDAIEKAVRDASGEKGVKEFNWSGLRYVRGDRVPHVVLQKASNEAGKATPAADQLKLTNSRFDAKGRLAVVGQRGSDPATLTWLTDNARKILEAADEKVGEGKLVDKEFAATFDAVAPLEKAAAWPLSPAALRPAFAGAEDHALRRVRVDRAYLVPSPAKADAANPGGVAWQYVVKGIAVGNPPDNTPTDATAIRGVCDAVIGRVWEQIKDSDVGALTDADNRAKDPAPQFQAAVAGRPTLDGVRIDARTAFGPDGELVLYGVQPGLDAAQKEELEKAVRAVIANLSANPDLGAVYRKLPEYGVSTAGLARVKVRDLHADLRKWAADTLDDVRLARLYFDATGQLTLTCQAPDKAVEAIVKDELLVRAPAVVPAVKADQPANPTPAPKDEKKPEDKKDDKMLAAPGRFGTVPVSTLQPAPAKLDPTAPPRVDFKTFPAALTQFLQQQVADGKKSEWYALLIERGYFDTDDRYAVRGVANSEEQRKAFGEYLASLKDDPRWAAYFDPKPPAPLDDKTFPVISMEKLVDRARRVMPGYEEFDGIRVVGARYVYVKDAANPLGGGQQLVFDAHLVGRPDVVNSRSERPAELLTRLIAADKERYGLRLPKARKGKDTLPRTVAIRQAPPRQIPPDEPVLGSDTLGDFSQGYGASWLAKGELKKAEEWLDRGLLHAPHVSAVWYLDAYYNHLNGDTELVRRDLFRIIPLEDPLAFDGPAQRKRRYAAAKDLQGPARAELEKFWLQCWKEYKDGAKPLTFAESK